MRQITPVLNRALSTRYFRHAPQRHTTWGKKVDKIVNHFKNHYVGYLVGIVGLTVNILYFGHEYFEHGNEFWEHVTSLLPEHGVIISTAPLFIIIGYLIDRKLLLECQIRESSEAFSL